MKQAKRIRESRGDRLFMILLYVLLICCAAVFVYPLYFVVIASFSEPATIYRGEVILWPQKIMLNGYEQIFADATIWTGYRNSIFYTVAGTVISLALTLPAAYALSRKDLAGRRIFMFFITVTMFFGGGLIPTYLVVEKLRLVGTVWAVLLTAAVSAWNLILARTFFETSVPAELLEAAQIDGCNNTYFFLKIVLPLSGSLIAIMALFYGVGQWNSYFKEMMYLSDSKMYPLQLVLRGILTKNTLPITMVGQIQGIAEKQQLADLIKYGLIVVSSIPVMIAYPFVQKYFVKGVFVGSIKG